MNKGNKQTKNTSGQSQKKGTKSPSNQQRRPQVQREQSAPVAFSKKVGIQVPRERTGKMGSRTIRYKEYVQDILGSVAFSAIQFQCNPGLSNLFAWLALQALFYQEYTVKAIRFVFETEKATTLSGKVMYAFLQDSSDPLPASKQEMMENQLKAAGAIWQPFALAISMSNFSALGRSRFVRSGNLAANLDVKTYDIGQLVVAVQGMADTSACGELYVEYEIELKTPISSSAQLANALSVEVTGVTPSQTSLYGTTPTLKGGLNVTATGNVLTFNTVGQYVAEWDIQGTGLQTVFAPTFSSTTVSGLSQKNGISNAAANAGTEAMFSAIFAVTARGQTLGCDCSGSATTITVSTCRISAYATANT